MIQSATRTVAGKSPASILIPDALLSYQNMETDLLKAEHTVMSDKELKTQKNISPNTGFIKKVRHELFQRTTEMDEIHSPLFTSWEFLKLDLKFVSDTLTDDRVGILNDLSLPKIPFMEFFNNIQYYYS